MLLFSAVIFDLGGGTALLWDRLGRIRRRTEKRRCCCNDDKRPRGLEAIQPVDGPFAPHRTFLAKLVAHDNSHGFPLDGSGRQKNSRPQRAETLDQGSLGEKSAEIGAKARHIISFHYSPTAA